MAEPASRSPYDRWIAWWIAACLGAVGLGCTGGEPTLSLDARAMSPDDAGISLEPASDAAPFTCQVMAPTSCPSPAPVYADVAPIFQRRCVVCHDAQPGGPWPLDSYGHVADWFDIIRDAMLSCSMPPPTSGFSMETSERVAILTWIRCGLRR